MEGRQGISQCQPRRASCGRSRIRCAGCAPITSTSIRCIGPTRWSRSKKPPRRCRRCSDRGRSAPSGSAISRSSRWSGFAAWRRCTCCSRPTICSSATSRPTSCPIAASNNIATFGYGALCRGLLSGRMRPNTAFDGDDLRRTDPKFQPPRFAQYLAAGATARSARAGAFRQARHRSGGALDARSRHHHGAVGRAPSRPTAAGRRGDSAGRSTLAAKAEIDRILRETITDPVGPEFMAPPPRRVAA